MGLLAKLFGGKKQEQSSDQCVLIRLDGVNLPDETYAEHDLSTLEDRLIDAIKRSGTGELDGNEIGPEFTTIYTYGPDADRLFRAMEPVLRAYPLCKGALVTVRRGGPGSPQTELQL